MTDRIRQYLGLTSMSLRSRGGGYVGYTKYENEGDKFNVYEIEKYKVNWYILKRLVETWKGSYLVSG